MSMTEWHPAELGSCVHTQKGYAFKSGWYCSDGRRIVKVSNFTDDSVDWTDLICIPETIAADYLKYALSAGDVVLQTVGSWPNNPASVVGKCVSIPSNAAGSLLNQNAVKLSPIAGLDRTFLFYLLRGEDFKTYIIGTAQGAASQAAITLDAIRSYRFSRPPLPTQQRIASILSAYDELIENSQRRIKILEAMARGLYREWFVHFRFPGHENHPRVASALGEIPDGWEVRSIKDVATVTYGFPFQSKKFNTNQIGSSVIRIRDILNAATTTFTDEVADAKYHIKNGDILVGMDGDFHMCIWSSGHALQNQRVAKFESSGAIGNHHLFLALELPIQTWNKSIVGTTVAHLGDMHIKAIQIVWPTEQILAKANRILEPMAVQIIALKRQIQNLRRTRDLLLPRLLSGQINVEAP